MFATYHVAFHGTSVQAVKSILESGQRLLPGDTTSSGFTIPHPTGYIKDGKCSLVHGHMKGCYAVVSKHKSDCKCGCVLFEPSRLFFTSLQSSIVRIQHMLEGVSPLARKWPSVSCKYAKSLIHIRYLLKQLEQDDAQKSLIHFLTIEKLNGALTTVIQQLL